MVKKSVLIKLCVALTVVPTIASAENIMVDDFSRNPSSRWEFIADSVMGGVSSGEIQFEQQSGDDTMTLSGSVSTANNGGFIQARRKLSIEHPKAGTGIILTVKGNGEQYFVHLRSFWTMLPWQYYQASFQAGDDWQEIMIPFAAFTPSGRVLPKTVKPGDVRSIGIVAFGRDHEADISVTEIRLY
jgi:hypothetical protein